jgi:hypothetical protein
MRASDIGKKVLDVIFHHHSLGYPDIAGRDGVQMWRVV